MRNQSIESSAPMGVLPTERHPDSLRLHAILRQLGELHDRKQADYGLKSDPFYNLRAAKEWGVRSWVGVMIRLQDKVKRLQSFAQRDTLVNESASDSFRDIAVYAILALILYEEEVRNAHTEK